MSDPNASTRSIYCFNGEESVPVMGVLWYPDRVVAVLRDDSVPGAVSWVPVPQVSEAAALRLVEKSKAHGRRIVDSAQ